MPPPRESWNEDPKDKGYQDLPPGTNTQDAPSGTA